MHSPLPHRPNSSPSHMGFLLLLAFAAVTATLMVAATLWAGSGPVQAKNVPNEVVDSSAVVQLQPYESLSGPLRANMNAPTTAIRLQGTTATPAPEESTSDTETGARSGCPVGRSTASENVAKSSHEVKIEPYDDDEITEGEMAQFKITITPTDGDTLYITIIPTCQGRFFREYILPQFGVEPEDSPYMFSIPTHNDTNDEPNGYLQIEVISSGYTVGSPDRARIDILDNDLPLAPAPKFSVSFSERTVASDDHTAEVTWTSSDHVTDYFLQYQKRGDSVWTDKTLDEDDTSSGDIDIQMCETGLCISYAITWGWRGRRRRRDG